MDGALQTFFAAGIADSSHRTYKTAEKRFLTFCNDFSLNPYPVNENILCYFAACLGQQGLTAATIRTYLAGVRQMQIAGGHPDPRISLMPRLRQVLRGVEIMKGRQGSTKRPRLPITPTILKRIKGVGFLSKEDRGRGLADQKMLWAASLTAFFGFCRSGEITLPQDGGYDSGIHLSYRDVAVDNPGQPRIISLLLRRSKTDQVGKGVKVILGRTGHDLCPVAAVLDYLGSRGSDSGPLFR